jgi:hypothetical protein
VPSPIDQKGMHFFAKVAARRMVQAALTGVF